jgi:hypothetical protein
LALDKQLRTTARVKKAELKARENRRKNEEVHLAMKEY